MASEKVRLSIVNSLRASLVLTSFPFLSRPIAQSGLYRRGIGYDVLNMLLNLIYLCLNGQEGFLLKI